MIPFLRWHPQLALRYLPLVKFINKIDIKNPTILEVGSGSLGIGPYLKREFTGVDIDFSGPSWQQLKKIKGQAEKLPFGYCSFDVVISVDVLEHLPPKNRARAIQELFRVSREHVVIAVPLGTQSEKQDQKLDTHYRQKFGKPFPLLKEQANYGLPTKAEINSWIKKSNQKYHQDFSVTVKGNRNLKLRWWLMNGWMSRSFFVNIFFRKVLLLFLPLLALVDKRPPHYRQIYYVKVKN